MLPKKKSIKIKPSLLFMFENFMIYFTYYCNFLSIIMAALSVCTKGYFKQAITEAIFQCLLYDGYAHSIGLNSVTYIPKGLTAQEFIDKWSGRRRRFYAKILNACDTVPTNRSNICNQIQKSCATSDTKKYIQKLQWFNLICKRVKNLSLSWKISSLQMNLLFLL